MHGVLQKQNFYCAWVYNNNLPLVRHSLSTLMKVYILRYSQSLKTLVALSFVFRRIFCITKISEDFLHKLMKLNLILWFDSGMTITGDSRIRTGVS